MEVGERVQRFDLDPSVPQSARVYDAWLGGKANYAADRETAARVIERRPEVVAAARANRRFLGRAIRYLAQRHAVTQFLDIGTGLPTADNTHQIAQRIDPRSRVVYVDSDPVVMAHARALFTSSPEGCCDYFHCDLRDTEYVLGHAARTLDFTQPVGVLLLAVLHFVPAADGPAGIVAALASDLASGSCVAISHLTADFAPEAVSGGVDAYNKLVPTPVAARTHAEVTALFAGLPLVAPGVVPVSEWRPEVIVGQVVDLYGGVARVPARRW
jgi:hypothetical protein